MIEPYLGLRPEGFICDFEYLVEIGSVLLWAGAYPKEIAINVAGNMSALSWMDGIRVLAGPSSRLQLSFHKELVRRHIRVHGMYLRPNRNSSSDFLTRESEGEINSCASQHVVTRRPIWEIWPGFISTNAATWDFAISGLPRLFYPMRDQEMFAGWNPETYTLCEVCLTLGLSRSWIDPYSYKIADLARGRNSPQYFGGRVDFGGALIHPNTELGDFRIPCVHINAISAFAMILEDLDLDTSGAFRTTSFVVDSSHLGDCLSGTWRILAHGVLHPFHTVSRESQSIRLLSD